MLSRWQLLVYAAGARENGARYGDTLDSLAYHVLSILGDPGADSGGEGKSKQAEK